MYTHVSGSGAWGSPGALVNSSGIGGSTPANTNFSQSYARVEMPAKETEVQAPDYVIINVKSTTKYEFKYTPGGSYLSAGVFNSDGYVELPIQPIAWKGGAGTLGHVSFVYKSPKDN